MMANTTNMQVFPLPASKELWMDPYGSGHLCPLSPWSDDPMLYNRNLQKTSSLPKPIQSHISAGCRLLVTSDQRWRDLMQAWWVLSCCSVSSLIGGKVFIRPTVSTGTIYYRKSQHCNKFNKHFNLGRLIRSCCKAKSHWLPLYHPIPDPNIREECSKWYTTDHHVVCKNYMQLKRWLVG